MFRETQLTISGRSFTVRTEMGGKIRTVKQLEAAQFEAVREAIVAARTEAVDARYRDMLPTDKAAQAATESARKWYTDSGKVELSPHGADAVAKAGENYRERTLAVADRVRADGLKRVTPRLPAFEDAARLRKPFPPVKYTYPAVPDSVREFMEES